MSQVTDLVLFMMILTLLYSTLDTKTAVRPAFGAAVNWRPQLGLISASKCTKTQHYVHK